MVDIVINPADRSITTNTYFPYYLNITDAGSRFFVPIGIQDKKGKIIFRAIQDWATSYGPGPSADFNLSQLSGIHGDFDSTTRSNELLQLERESNIKVSSPHPAIKNKMGYANQTGGTYQILHSPA
jgi:hypothetical protein